MKLIDDLDGSLLKLWRFWSVRLNVLSGACSGAVGVYEGFRAVDPAAVRWVPLWIICMLVAGAVVFTFFSLVARGIVQPKLRDRGADDNAEHA